MLKAVIFDLDGTLINSEHFYLECWNEILSNWNGSIDAADWLENFAGKPVHTNAQRLIERFSIPMSMPELVSRRELLTVERFKTTDVELMPYTLDILRFFEERGIAMAIVTSSMRPDVEAIFNRNGLAPFFRHIVTRTDVKNGKPHPEGYQLGCSLLDAGPNDCIVFEDTLNGLTAAKAAGLVCYAVQSNLNEHYKLIAADAIFTDFLAAKDFIIENKIVS